jgi:hypothetical protein
MPRKPDKAAKMMKRAKGKATPESLAAALAAPVHRKRGFFVAFGYSSDAERECAGFHKRTGRIIRLLTVQEILDEEHVQKM